ncbi:MAG: phosphatidylserine decarboxylase family protein, partial [Mycobacterium sp.]
MARRPRATGENPALSLRHLVSLLRSTVPPVHPAGLPFVSAGVGLALLGRRHRWLRRAGLLTA